MKPARKTSAPASPPSEDRARQIVDGIGDGFLSVDAEWRISDANVTAARFLQHRLPNMLGRNLWEVAGLSEDSSFAALARRVAETQTVQEAEITYRRNQRTKLLAIRSFPLGAGVGATFRDITASRRAEQRLARSEARYHELAHGTPAASWVSRANGKLEFVNQAMADALGRPREALLGDGWIDAIDPANRPTMLAAREQARASHSSFHYEGLFRRADGALRVIQLYGRPRFDRNGAFRGHVGMATDVTETREAHQRQKLLIDELNHRVKNTLATVQSVVRLTLREEGVAKKVESLLSERLLALSAAHDVLTLENWSGAELTDISKRAATPYDGLGQITLGGPKARLTPKTAIALSMALHELVTNAVKHGALSEPTGSAQLSWVNIGDTVVLEWRESGGPTTRPPERTGYGHRLLGAVLAGELGQPAELIYAPKGLICRIRAPTTNGSQDSARIAELGPSTAFGVIDQP